MMANAGKKFGLGQQDQGKGDGSFERAVTDAFEHVFEHLGRLNDHVALSGPDGGDAPLKPGESPTLR